LALEFPALHITVVNIKKTTETTTEAKMTPIFYNWLRRIRRQGTIKPRSAFQYMQEESATMQSVPDKNTATILNSIQQHHFKKTAK